MPTLQKDLDLQRQRQVMQFAIATNKLPGVRVVAEHAEFDHMDYSTLTGAGKILNVYAQIEIKWLSIAFEQVGCAGVFMPLEKALHALDIARTGNICRALIWFSDGSVRHANMNDLDRRIVWVENPHSGTSGPHMTLPWKAFERGYLGVLAGHNITTVSPRWLKDFKGFDYGYAAAAE